jgi:hypothetical protein
VPLVGDHRFAPGSRESGIAASRGAMTAGCR